MTATKHVIARPSMADVARIAQVSTQTVSRYFTGVGYVREETRERIAAAIEDLGYRRNQSARSFRTQRTDMIGVLSMGPINYGSAEILTGLGVAAHAVGMTLTISQMDVDRGDQRWHSEVRQSLEHLMSIPVDGVLVVTPYAGVEGLLRDLMGGATPFVAISDRPETLTSLASIHSHDAAVTATEHLLGLGHVKVVHLAGPPGRNETDERVRGYRDAMVAAGHEPVVVDLATDWSPSGGYAAARDLRPPEDFTAVLCANDEIALGFLRGMEEVGLHAPADFSIVGTDDMPAAAYFSPPLTTVRLDFRELGVQGFRMLQAELTTGEPAPHHAVEPTFVVRGSTAALG
ncbi:LacI family DNA-binding transcriptional regulator [Microlunatus spumicola]|uniref:LacI family DNA-binding transcriptional regulator n=1 Tax=Microlunatus spumicola TaxID=81499 RepID=A0ABP6XP22_9ACTN